MNSNPTVADSLRGVPTKWLWLGTFALAAFAMGIFDLFEILMMALGGGLGDPEKETLAIIAWITAPLTAGIFLLTLAWITGWHESLGWSSNSKALAALGLLFLLGLAAPMAGLGLSGPNFANTQGVGGSLLVNLASIVLGGYLNLYGFLLMACSIAIGATFAIQVERWWNDV